MILCKPEFEIGDSGSASAVSAFLGSLSLRRAGEPERDLRGREVATVPEFTRDRIALARIFHEQIEKGCPFLA
jgi:hypothetical protein